MEKERIQRKHEEKNRKGSKELTAVMGKQAWRVSAEYINTATTLHSYQVKFGHPGKSRDVSLMYTTGFPRVQTCWREGGRGRTVSFPLS